MFGKLVIRLGDPTSHGGQVVSASSTFDMFGKSVALIGDKVTCPQKGHGVCTIVEGDPTWTVDGRNVALEGHKTSCGAVLISTLPNVTRSYEGMGAASFGNAAGTFLTSAAEVTEESQAGNEPHGLRFQALESESGEPLSFRNYIFTRADGSTIEGTTDEDGFTDPVQANEAESISLHISFKAPKKDLKMGDVA